VLIVAVVVLLVLGGGVWWVVSRLNHTLPAAIGPACQVRTATGEVRLEPAQMANAATITAVGLRRHMPDRAVVVALAAALQESKLENLPHGDRDSIGLFQQRPSQGWGSAAQLQDPRYAAGKFYSALLRVKGWQDLRVTEAAQRVQRSAYPEAYDKWADEAGVLAEALVGRAASAVACTQVGAPSQRGAAAADLLNRGLKLDWGQQITTFAATGPVGLVVAAADTRSGWQFAHWIVAHSGDTGVERVRFGGQEWSADSGTWSGVEDTDVTAGGVGERVVAEVYGA
jgi:hypothetical protein